MQSGIRGIALVLALSGVAMADTVAVFANGNFVDISGTASGNEAITVQATLTALGHTPAPFVGISGAAWGAAAAGAGALLIPELERTSVFERFFLGNAVGGALRSYVGGGGTLIMMGGSGNNDVVGFLNQVFGFSLDDEGTSGTAFKRAATAGTPFDAGPGSLPNLSRTTEIDNLPGGSSIYYSDGGDDATVARLPYVGGQIFYIGWDWFNAAPIGSRDGGWSTILGAAISSAGGGQGAPTPEPGTLALLGAAVAGFAIVRRRRS